MQYNVVHVADVGTLFKARLLTDGVDYDPTGFSVAHLVFSTPLGRLSKAATVLTEGEGDRQKWYLIYFSETGLFTNPGVYTWQGDLTFPDGSIFHTNTKSFIVKANL